MSRSRQDNVFTCEAQRIKYFQSIKKLYIRDANSDIFSKIINNQECSVIIQSDFTISEFNFFIDVIQYNTQIRKLEISFVNLNDSLIKDFAQSLHSHPSLKELVLCNCRFGNQEVSYISKLIRTMPNFEKLTLEDNEIGTIDLLNLINTMPNLKKLNLLSNIITEGEEHNHLVDSIHSLYHLKTIGLHGNLISNESAAMLLNNLQNIESLEKFAITSSNFGDLTAFAVADLIYSLPNLLEFTFSDNNITNRGAKAISQGIIDSSFSSKTLQYINLSSNNITSQGLISIIDTMKHVKNLIILDLDNNEITSEVIDKIYEFLVQHKTITQLNLVAQEPISYFDSEMCLDAVILNPNIEAFNLNIKNNLWYKELENRLLENSQIFKFITRINEEYQEKGFFPAAQLVLSVYNNEEKINDLLTAFDKINPEKFLMLYGQEFYNFYCDFVSQIKHHINIIFFHEQVSVDFDIDFRRDILSPNLSDYDSDSESIEVSNSANFVQNTNKSFSDICPIPNPITRVIGDYSEQECFSEV